VTRAITAPQRVRQVVSPPARHDVNGRDTAFFFDLAYAIVSRRGNAGLKADG